MVDTQPGMANLSNTALSRTRLGLVCDFLEENWPSMELVAGMLSDNLTSQHAGQFSVTRLCPPMRRYFKGPFGNRNTLHNIDRLLNRFVNYPRWLQRQAPDFDLFHVIDHSYSQLLHYLPHGRTVVTCHDLDTFRCLLHPDLEPRSRWFRAMTNRILQGFKKAAHVIAVSAVTRDEIIRHGLFTPDRVTVVSNGVHPSCSPLPNQVADAELERLLPRNANSTVWLLNVGSTMKRKRMDVLLRVLAAVRRQIPSARLLRVGEHLTGSQSQLARELGIDDAIVQLPTLSREVLAATYRRAHLLLHTAEAEGFGLPVVEAMACGCPVVATDLPVLREVGGNAAVYCPLGNIPEWNDHVTQLLEQRAQQSQMWEGFRKQAMAHASRFSWAEAARNTATIYNTLLRSSPRPDQDYGRASNWIDQLTLEKTQSGHNQPTGKHRT